MIFKSCHRSAIVFQHFLSESLSQLHLFHPPQTDMYHIWSQRTQFFATIPQDNVPCWIILCVYVLVLPHKTPWQKAQHDQWQKGRRDCWVVLPLNYLLTAPLGTMATVAQTRESPRTALNWVTASHLKKNRGSHFGMGMRCFSLFCWGQNHLWPNNL